MSTKELESGILTQSQKEIFKNWLPQARITDINEISVPKEVRRIFQPESTHPVLTWPDSSLVANLHYLITYKDGQVAFATRLVPKKELYVESTFLVEAVDGKIQGYSELVLIDTPNPYFYNKPYEYNSNTYPNYRRQGLAIRRTLTLNALSQMMYGLPLYSSTDFLISKDIKNDQRIKAHKLVWGKITAFDLATKFQEGNEERFVFVSEL